MKFIKMITENINKLNDSYDEYEDFLTFYREHKKLLEIYRIL